MSDLIRAIPTRYNQLDFRSRTEARWAVFFDLIGIRYQYEPEKVHTGLSRYIPDFILDLGGRCEFWDMERAFFEVKGCQPTMVEYEKLANALPPFDNFKASRVLWRAFIASGPVNKMSLEVVREPYWGNPMAIGPAEIRQCPMCGSIAFSSYIPGKERRNKSLSHHCCDAIYDIAKEYDVSPHFLDFSGDKDPGPEDSPLITLAAEYAQNARFENPNFYQVFEMQKQMLKRLRESGMFASAQTVQRLHFFALRLKKGECPQFAPTPEEPGYKKWSPPKDYKPFKIVSEGG